jgi:hypothetical protein
MFPEAVRAIREIQLPKLTPKESPEQNA